MKALTDTGARNSHWTDLRESTDHESMGPGLTLTRHLEGDSRIPPVGRTA